MNVTLPRAVRKNVLEPAAALLHLLHGTRGLAIGGAGLLLLGILQPLMPAQWSRFWLVAPVFTVLMMGLATLPREGVAVQQRTRSLLGTDAAAGRLARTLVWPGLLVILLLPRLFLGIYGIPHMTPLTGLVLPSVQQRITHAFLFAVLLLTVAYLRGTKRYARHIIPKRPRDLSHEDRTHEERDALLWLGLLLFITFAFVLRSFWQPFSLLDWPPDFSSLQVGIRGVTSITFSVALPIILFSTISGHARLVRAMFREHAWRDRADVLGLAAAHVVIGMVCVGMHLYNLLWIAQYRASAPF